MPSELTGSLPSAVPESQLFVELDGDPDGPPMLMIHGALSWNAQWDLNRAALRERHRLIMVEQMGHGRSDRPDDVEAYGPASVLGELELIRETLGVDTWWVCGQSLGGAISLRYTLDHQDRVRGLVITNSRAAFGIARAGVSRGTKGAAAASDGGAGGQPSAPWPKPATTRDLPIHPANATRLDEAVKARLIEGADALPIDVFSRVGSHRDEWDSSGRLDEVRVPMLVVNGRWEKAFQPSLELARAGIGHLQVVDLEGGHAINIERAAEFDEAVLAFARD